MSRKFKKSYSAFQRHILKEFMTEADLKKLDRRYNSAKAIRAFTRIMKEEKKCRTK